MIPISLHAYDLKGELIQGNKKGESIIKGNVQSYIFDGVGSFDKIKMNEVSSIYYKRKINLVISTKVRSFGYFGK